MANLDNVNLGLLVGEFSRIKILLIQSPTTLVFWPHYFLVVGVKAGAVQLCKSAEAYRLGCGGNMLSAIALFTWDTLFLGTSFRYCFIWATVSL